MFTLTLSETEQIPTNATIVWVYGDGEVDEVDNEGRFLELDMTLDGSVFKITRTHTYQEAGVYDAQVFVKNLASSLNMSAEVKFRR